MSVVAIREKPWLLGWRGRVMWIGATVLASGVSALLISRGRWLLILILLAAAPAFLVIQRFPLAVLALWFLVVPFLTDLDDGGRLKLVYWLVHRMMPLAALVVVLVSYATKTGLRHLGKLEWAEVLLLAYLVVSVLSILYTSNDVDAQLRHLYDRVAVPMILYVLIRLLRPGATALKTMTYILAFILLSQAAVGLASWVAPEIVADRFLGRVGERTTGTLDQANVFGIVALAAGALFLHASRYVDDWRRKAGVAAFVMSVAMAFFTFSRASWLAAVVVVAGMAFVYPRVVAKASILGASALLVFMLVGGNQGFGEYLDSRLYSAESERSALSRLPVINASLRMIEAKPLTGWGYGNFDLYDNQFKSRAGELFVPDKDQASHNLFLTLGAEQGFIGLIAYLGVAVYWLFRTPRAMARLKSDDLMGRRLMVILWAILAAHVVVSNFFNMRVGFGLAVWWLSLALIGNMITARPVLASASSKSPTATSTA